MERGYAHNPDLNGADSDGIGAIPMNNQARRPHEQPPSRTSIRCGTASISPLRATSSSVASSSTATTSPASRSRAAARFFTVETDQVVLSAGALKSPHILMLSGIGPRDQLTTFGVPVIHELPGVGQNLFNHPMGNVSFQVKDHVELHANAGALRFGLRITSEEPSYPSDVMLHTLGVFNVMTGEHLPDRTARIACALELPDGSGWVRLASSDPTEQPEINYRYFHNENDMRRMRDAVRLAADMLESEAYRDVLEHRTAPTDDVLADDATLDAWIRQSVGTSRHVSGTCRIGPDADPMAVTDQQCRVRGVQGLWVADSSIMPQVTRANTNATAIMIGERVADWIASQ